MCCITVTEIVRILTSLSLHLVYSYQYCKQSLLPILRVRQLLVPVVIITHMEGLEVVAKYELELD